MLVSRSATYHILWSLLVQFEGGRCLAVHNLFKGKSSPISSTLRCTFSFEEIMYVRSAIFCLLHKLEVFCHSFPFQRPLRDEHNFFKINSKFKGKCSLNAEHFKRYLRDGPLLKVWFYSMWTMLKERAFEQRIATLALPVVRHSL